MPNQNATPELLLPTRNIYPFDPICLQIIEALEKRNFDVPEIRITFQELDTEKKKYLMVKEITGTNFRLVFCKVERKVSPEALLAMTSVRLLVIPKMELSVFSDMSGPELVVYAGDAWKEDCDWFMYNAKMHSKKDGGRRRYLRYEGSRVSPITYREEKAEPRKILPYLRHSNNLGKEYSLAGNEPAYFRTKHILLEFKRWLVENTLTDILWQPTTQKISAATDSSAEVGERAQI